MVPSVWMPRNIEEVCIKTPLGTPEEYLETTLTPEEAETLAFDLWADARRARHCREVSLRLKRRAIHSDPPLHSPASVEETKNEKRNADGDVGVRGKGV
jgi:hypothetical protein